MKIAYPRLKLNQKFQKEENALEQVLREGARNLLAQAIENEVNE